jgi:hypothetical protein
MRYVIGYISILDIRKQITAATLAQQQFYSEVLASGNLSRIDSFLREETNRQNGNKRIVLVDGKRFKVSACVLGLDLEYQYDLHKLVEALKPGLWWWHEWEDETGIKGEFTGGASCSLSDDETEIKFWTGSHNNIE